MLQAFKEHNDDEVLKIISEDNNPEVDGITILSQLVSNSDDISYALRMGVDPNGTTEFTDPPIFKALGKNDGNLKKLITAGANVNAVNYAGYPVIFKVSTVSEFELLVSRSVNVDVLVEGLDSESPSAKTNLYDYVKKRNFSKEYKNYVVNYFATRSGSSIEKSIKNLKNKTIVLINKNPHTSKGYLLIHIAVKENDIPYAKALLKSGANPNAYHTQELINLMNSHDTTVDYETPLHIVRSVEMLNILVEYGAYIDGVAGTRPILNSRSIEIFDAFVDNGAEVEEGDEEAVEERLEKSQSISNFDLATHYLNRDISSLKQSQSVISEGNIEDKSLLEHILDRSCMKKVVYAINLGATPNVKNSSGKDLLQMNIDNYLRVKICLQYGIGDMVDAMKYATKPRVIELLDRYLSRD